MIGLEMIVLGVDVGLSGALCFYDGRRILKMDPMPLVGKELQPHNLAVYIRRFMKDRVIDHAFIEHAQAMPKQGVSSMFKYGTGFGILQGVVAALEIPITLVKPREWQKEMHKGTDSSADPKDRSAYAAYSLFPNMDWRATEKSKKNHDGLIDAALVAAYGYRVLSFASEIDSDDHSHKKTSIRLA